MNWFHLVKKSLLKRKKKSMILLTAIAMGVFIISAFISSYQGMVKSVEKGVESFGQSYVLAPKQEDRKQHISYHGIPIVVQDEQPPLTLTTEDYEEIAAEYNHAVAISPRSVLRVYEEELQQNFAIVGIDIESEKKMKPWWKIYGKWPANENEIVIGHEIRNQYQLHAGDELTLTVNGETSSFVISGALHYTGLTDDRLLFFDFHHNIKQSPLDIHFVEMVLPFHQTGISSTPEGWEWKDAKSALGEERLETVNKISDYAPYILGFTVFLGALIILITLILQVEERRSEFALWQAVGLTKKLIVRMLMMEIFIIAIIGTVIGVILGILSAHTWSALMSGLEFFAWISMVQIIFIMVGTIVVTMLISIYPLIRALRQEPISLLGEQN
ncbi:ABC transporter permease [Anaerobacillus sp. MEB173]|uniref:ABC transporter permease n=1 Tax=Anaerobacillus sp. MEB173 TaxID=3383345 RepID=UPI003F91022B